MRDGGVTNAVAVDWEHAGGRLETGLTTVAERREREREGKESCDPGIMRAYSVY